MADVFLSYAHADCKIVQRLAGELTAAGLSVWLDREIHGGAEFAKLIEREISAARHVVVLWSSSSIDSRWVRDEASLALDAGKLVPTSIGGVQPPLGFRQLQAVPLDDWAKGRVEALPEALGRALATDTVLSQTRPGPLLGSRVRRWWPGGLLVIVLGTAMTWWALEGQEQGDGGVLAVAPLNVAPQDAAAKVLQQSLANDLSRVVIGHDAQLNFVEVGDRPDLVNADYVLTGDASSSGERLHATVRVTHASDGIILWSRDFEGDTAAVAPLRQRMSVRVADVLLCALGSRSKRPDDIDLSTLRLFLSGCENMHPEADTDWHVARDFFRQVVGRRPDFAQARALYAASLALSAGTYSVAAPSQWASIREEARREARQAIDQDSSLGDAYFAVSNTYGYDMRAKKLATIERGLTAAPDTALLHNSLGVVEVNMGFPAKSFDELQKARELDPFSPLITANVIEAMAFAGRFDEAETLLEESLINWPDQFYLLEVGFNITARLGDPGKALDQLDAIDPPYRPPLPDLWRLFLAARIDGGSEAAARFASAALAKPPSRDRERATLIHSLVQLGRIDDAYRLALAGPIKSELDFTWFLGTMAPFRADPRFLRLMLQQGLMEFWRGNGLVPEFCSEKTLRYRCDLG